MSQSECVWWLMKCFSYYFKLRILTKPIMFESIMRIYEDPLRIFVIIFDDVISGWKRRCITTSFGVIEDFGLNFDLKQSKLDFRPLGRCKFGILRPCFQFWDWKKLTKIDANWTSEGHLKLSRVHRIRCVGQFFHKTKLEDP